MARGLEEARIEPPTSWLVDGRLFVLGHSRMLKAAVVSLRGWKFVKNASRRLV